MKCPYCGSENIEEGLLVAQSSDVGSIGFQSGKVFMHPHPLYADLCNECGSVVRFFIKENPKEIKNWRK